MISTKMLTRLFAVFAGENATPFLSGLQVEVDYKLKKPIAMRRLACGESSSFNIHEIKSILFNENCFKVLCYSEDDNHIFGLEMIPEDILNKCIERAENTINTDIWIEDNYDVEVATNGDYYQFYSRKHKKTGELRFLVAKYLNNYCYMTQEAFEKILGRKLNE